MLLYTFGIGLVLGLLCYGIGAAGDDGGDYSDRDPSARLERQERDRQYQQQRRHRNR